MSVIGEKEFIILSSGNMNALNGSAKYVKLFFENKSFFEEKQVHVDIYTNSDGFSDEVSYRKSITFKYRDYLNSLAVRFKFLNLLKFFRSLRMAKIPVSRFMNSKSDNKIVLLNDFFVAYTYFRKFGTRNRSMVVLHNNGDMLSMIEGGLPWYFKKRLYSMRDLVLQSASCFICEAKPAEELFVNQNPELKNKVKYIPIGCKKVPEKRKYEIQELHIVTVGTICKRKNQLQLLQALKEMNNSTIQIIIIGDGPMKDECENYVRRYNLGNQVDFVGSQRDIIPILERANLFVMTSLDEGLPISAQEAMNVGLPLILTNVGGCRELIKENGIIIEPNSISELVNAISWFDNHKNKVIELGTKSREIFLERYTQEKMFNNYIECINSL